MPSFNGPGVRQGLGVVCCKTGGAGSGVGRRSGRAGICNSRGCGRRLVRQLAWRGHEPFALHRKPEQGSELKTQGARLVEGRLLEPDSGRMAQLMFGSDVLVFTVDAGGVGMDLTSAIDGRGLELALAATQQPQCPV
ncbi:NAD(P)H-binding protein [Pseudomonas farris]